MIASKTKMHEGRVCVGGVDLDKHCSLRLMDRNGRHDTRDDCKYEIYQVWDMTYIMKTRRGAPHNHEDCNVTSAALLYTYTDRGSLISLLRESGMHVNEGPLTNVFDGKLKSEGAACFISQPEVPDHSTCFWIADRDLRMYRYGNDIRYRYSDPSSYNGWVSIKYVGLDDNPRDIIPAGTLIRLSLANWWQKDDAPELRCYLQLSGYYDKG